MSSDKILNDLKAGKLENIAKYVLEYVGPVFGETKVLEADFAEYGLFSVKFLHTSISHLGSQALSKTLLEAIHTCVNCFLKTRENVKLSEPLTVHKVLYHILIKLPHKGYFSDILQIGKQLHNEIKLTDEKLLSNLAAIISNSYSTLWNIAVKLEQDSEFTEFGQTLELRHLALQFFLMKEKNVPNMVQKFLLALNRHDQLISKTERLKNSENYNFKLQFELCGEISNLILENVSVCDNIAGHVISMLEVFLYKCKNLVHFKLVDDLKLAVTELRQIKLRCMSKGGNLFSLDFIGTVSQFLCDLVDKRHYDQKVFESFNSCQLEIDELNVKTIVILKDLFVLILTEIKLCVDSSSMSDKADYMLRSATGVLKKFLKTILRCLSGGDKGDIDRKLTAQLAKTLLDSIHIELQLMYKSMQYTTDEAIMCEMAEKTLSVMSEYETLFNSDHVIEKMVDQERYFCGYLMLKIGHIFHNKGLDTVAVEFYSTACQQLTVWCSSGSNEKQRYKEINLWKVYECLAECLRRNGKLHLAMETVADCLLVDNSSRNSAVKIWVRAKKELVKLEPNRPQGTLYAMLQQKTSGMIEVDPVQLLQSELAVIKSGKRKWPELEYGVLMNLLEVTNTPPERGRTLLDLIQHLWSTGHQSQRTIEDYLEDVSSLLTLNLTTEVKNLMGDVHLWQYIMKHEKICQQLKDSAVMKANRVVAPGEESEQNVETMTTVYTLWEETDATTELTMAVDMWQEYCTDVTLREKPTECAALSQSLLLCSSLFRLLRKPLDELRTLILAEKIGCCHSDIQTVTQVNSHIAMVLMEFGRYEEACNLLAHVGDVQDVAEIEESYVSDMLRKSEIYLKRGQVCEGMRLLSSVLEWDKQHQNKTITMCQIEGTAKYLASLYLRLPNAECLIDDGCLFMAHEAMRMHTGVVHFLLGTTENAASAVGNSRDKWTVLHELLTSMLNLGQMYRHVGEAREAKCYLREGWKLSHALGLPSWSLEFLLEITRVYSIGGAHEEAIKSSKDIIRVLEDSHAEDVEAYSSKPKLTKNKKPCVKLNFVVENNESTPASFLDLDTEEEHKYDRFEDEIERLISPILNKSHIKAELSRDDYNRFVYEQYFSFVLAELLNMLSFNELCERLLLNMETCIANNSSFSHIGKTVDGLVTGMGRIQVANKKNKSANGYKLPCKTLDMKPMLKRIYLESFCLMAEVLLVVDALPKSVDAASRGLELFNSGKCLDILHYSFLEVRLYFLQILAKLKSENDGKERQHVRDRTRTSVDEVVDHLQKMKIENDRDSGSDSDVMIIDDIFAEKMTISSSQIRKGVKFQHCEMDQVFKTPVKNILADLKNSGGDITSSRKLRDSCEVILLDGSKSPDLFVDSDEDFVHRSEKIGRGRGKRGRGRGQGRGRTVATSKVTGDTGRDVDSRAFDISPDTETEKVKSRSRASKIPKPADQTDLRKSSRPGRGRHKNLNTIEAHSSSLEIETVRIDNDNNSVDLNYHINQSTSCHQEVPQVTSTVDNISRTGEKNRSLRSKLNNDVIESTSKTVGLRRAKRQPNCKNFDAENDVYKFDGPEMIVSKQLNTKSKLRTRNQISENKERVREARLSPEKMMNDLCDLSLTTNNKATPESPCKFRDMESPNMTRIDCSMKPFKLLFSSSEALQIPGFVQTYNSLDENIQLSPVRNPLASSCKSERMKTVCEKSVLVSPVCRTQNTCHIALIADSIETDDILASLNDSVEIIRGGGEKEVKSRKGRTSRKNVGSRTPVEATEQAREELKMEQHSVTVLMDNIHQSHSVIMCVERDEVISTLERAYQQMCHFPACPLHSQLCNMLALQYITLSSSKAAFYLTEAMSLTFRHQALLNVGKKIRKLSKDNVSGDKVCELDCGEDVPSRTKSTHAAEKQMLTNLRKSLCFNKTEEDMRKMLKTLPAGWTVCQVSDVHLVHDRAQLIITRFQKDKDPVVVQLPGIQTYQGRTVLPEFESILSTSSDSMKVTDKIQWWKIRRELNDRMQSLVDDIEKYWLGHWKGMLFGSSGESSCLQSEHKEMQKMSKASVDQGLFEVLVNSAVILSDVEVMRVLTELSGVRPGTAMMETMVKSVRSWTPQIETDTRNPVILILDKSIQHLPWESLPILRSCTVSRFPSLYHLHSQLSFIHADPSSVYNKGLDLRSTYFILNPDNNLPYTQQAFEKWFTSERGWKGVVGQNPTPEEFTEALTAHDLLVWRRILNQALPQMSRSHIEVTYGDIISLLSVDQFRHGIWYDTVNNCPSFSKEVDKDIWQRIFCWHYCGHGSGSMYLPGDNLLQLRCHAAAILMGCSSGRLQAKGQLEASGMVLNYFLAGCPTVIANLWDVTDKDIDRFLESLLKSWLQSSGKKSDLLTAVPTCRQSCKLPYLIGCAPVVYGLPIFASPASGT